ncbi:MAG: STAS domain-containing protein [Nocardioidaceae bacterium]|nr:STAS domain-containing protein [Nocardioidaceae bacterium]
MPSAVTCAYHEDHTVVALAGELDLTSGDLLRAALVRGLHDHPRLVLDLSRLTFIDSGCLSLLLAATKLARETDGRMRVAAPQPHVRRTLMLTRLDRVLEIYDSVEEAVAGPEPVRAGTA